MACEHGIGLDMEYEPLGRAPCPEGRISLRGQGIVGGIYLDSIEVLGIKSKSAFRGSDLPRVEAVAFYQGLLGPRSRAHPYPVHI